MFSHGRGRPPDQKRRYGQRLLPLWQRWLQLAALVLIVLAILW
ncbi:hypothetical protein [Acrocarpospora sp. B8E8]